MSSSKRSMVAEYAKTGRSWCRTCSVAIKKGTPRMAWAPRDPRVCAKWQHVTCFTFTSDASAADIIGFDSLTKDNHREDLKKLIEYRKARNQVTREDGDEEKNSSKRKRKKALQGEDWDIPFSMSNVKNYYKKAKLTSSWRAFETIIFIDEEEGLFDSVKIAAFDFYGCLVNISGESVGRETWSFTYKSIPAKLQSLYSDRYKLVIFMNESSIDRSMTKRQAIVDSKTGMLEDFIRKVNVPVQVYIACGVGKSDRYRKPRTGMWHLMEWRFNGGRHVDRDTSFYVGDSAGRVKDHSDADLKFAQAVGVKFYSPEEYFGEPLSRSRKRKSQS